MTTITTTSYATPFQYPPQSYLERSPTDGSLWVMVRASTANVFELWKSLDNGSSWSMHVSLTRANVIEWARISIDKSGMLNWAYRTNESSQDRVYYRCVSTAAGSSWQSEVLLASPANGGVAGAVYTGVEVVSYITADRYSVVAVGTIAGGSIGVTLLGAKATPRTAAAVATNAFLTGTRQWLYTASSGRIGPSLDIEHTGDGHTTSTPHLWVAFGRTKIAMVKCAWTGSGWVGPGAAIDLLTGLGAQDAVTGRWDGTRFLVAAPDPSVTDTVKVAERDKANTTTTTRSSPTHTTGVVRNCALAYDAVTGDIRVYAVGTSTDVLYYVSYVRGTDSWTSWATVLATAILSVNNWGVRRAAHGNARHDVYTAHSGSPNTLTHTSQTLAYPPYVPTWVTLTGQPAEVAASLLLDWAFSDPDPGDTQSAYAVSRQIGAGALAYWRASDSTWQATEQKNTSATTQLTLASSWGADGDANHVYKVKVWDSGDVASSYSAPLDVIPSTAANPTLTAPTEGGTVTTPVVSVTWTVSQQTALRVTLTKSAVVVFDSGWVVSATASYIPPFELEHGATYTVGVRTKNNEGLASAEDTNTFSVVFVGPAMPVLAITPITASGLIRVVVTHPAPGPVTFVAVGAADSDFGVGASVVPGMPAGVLPGDLLVILAAIRNSGTGTVDELTGWSTLLESGNVALLAREAQPGDVAPTVTFTGGLSNSDVLAQMAAFRGASTVASASATQLNGSAQNIDYPALTVPVDNQLIIIAGWKIDDWTSVDTLAGMTEMGEPVSTGGDDEGIVWDYLIQTTKANISAGSFTVTGGAAGISRGVTVAIQPRPAVVEVDLWRIPVADPNAAVRLAAGLAPGPTFDDWHAAAATEYAYRATAVGANGIGSSKTGLGQGQGYYT